MRVGSPTWWFFALLAIALIFGGGGSRYGLANAVVQLFALGLFIWHSARLREFSANAPRALIFVASLTVLIPLVQLLPLPPSVWTQLPARDMVGGTFQMLGKSDAYFPISFDRARTLTALFSLVPAIALLTFIISYKTSGSSRWLGLWLVALVVMGLANFAFGAIQLLTNNGPLNPYPVIANLRLYGFFASHNTGGLMFVVALCALFALDIPASGRGRSTARSWWKPAVAGCLFLAILLTQSRSSIALSAIPISAMLIRSALAARTDGRLRNNRFLWAGVAIAAVGLVFVATNPRIQATWERFNDLEDARPAVWTDTISGIERYWPVGSGVGTFDEVFQVEESLETLHPLKAGRAHSEYLEILLESGVVGALMLLLWAMFLIHRMVKIRKLARPAPAIAASLGISVILLQAIIDYPFRNQTMICVAAVLVALLVAHTSRIEGRVK